MTSLLNVRNLSVHISSAHILRDVTLAIEQGESISIIGPNGAGKTTLLKVLLGLNAHYQGQVELLGKPLASYTVKERAQWMGYVPQHHDFADFSTVEEFIWMGRYPYMSVFRQPKEDDHQAVQAAMQLTEIQHMAGRILQTLSGGEQQKVLIAAALAQQPKALLLDEPATFLDPRNQIEIQRLLGKINRETGTTIIAVTHDINSALHASSRIVALKSGQVTFDGPPASLANEAVLFDIYQTRFRLITDAISGDVLIAPALAMLPEGLP